MHIRKHAESGRGNTREEKKTCRKIRGLGVSALGVTQGSYTLRHAGLNRKLETPADRRGQCRRAWACVGVGVRTCALVS